MAIPKAIASIKRFGPRYGRTVKHRFGEVEAMHRKTYKCPYCSKTSVTRVAVGIWHCDKCNAKFASKAYTVVKKKSIKELMAEVAAVEKKEQAEIIEEQKQEEAAAEEIK